MASDWLDEAQARLERWQGKPHKGVDDLLGTDLPRALAALRAVREILDRPGYYADGDDYQAAVEYALEVLDADD